jgi:hypothetical protein
VESSCELGNEPSGSIKCWESTEWLHNLWPLERYSSRFLLHDNTNGQELLVVKVFAEYSFGASAMSLGLVIKLL